MKSINRFMKLHKPIMVLKFISCGRIKKYLTQHQHSVAFSTIWHLSGSYKKRFSETFFLFILRSHAQINRATSVETRIGFFNKGCY